MYVAVCCCIYVCIVANCLNALEVFLCQCRLFWRGVLQESKSETAAGDGPVADNKSTESEDKKLEVKTKTTTVRANITWQSTVRDLADPSDERLKRSKKLYVVLILFSSKLTYGFQVYTLCLRKKRHSCSTQ